jgi:hypothetical protein
MPRKAIDYQNTVIYKIVCKDEDCDYIYVGHTTDFVKRKCHHKSSCNNPSSKEYNNKKYVEMRNNGGFDNFKMLEIKKFPCNDKREAETEEDKVMIELDANMNTIRASRNKKQWINDNKEQYKQYKKQYYEDNKEQRIQYYETNKAKIKEQKTQKYDCPCGGKYTNSGKSRHFKTKLHQQYMEQK